MSIAGPTPFIRNPATDIRVMEADADGPVRIMVSAYSAVHGFTETMLDRSDQPALAAALALAAGRVDVLEGLSPGVALPLWGSGLIILPPEQVPAFAPARFAISPDGFTATGFTLIPDCLTPAMVGVLAAYYRGQVDSGAARLSNGGIDRHSLHNDPAGRVVQRVLLPAVEALVGRPVKPSYSYASLYRHGAELPVHTDRSQCKYTLSLLIDHQPVPADGVSPWAIQIHPQSGADPVDCFQSLGGGILFRGQDLSHGRRPLPADEICWTLLVHYVDADSTGSLD